MNRRAAHQIQNRKPQNPSRTGATLTEVLMAILIMAVGVISVFTLFPISVLRTIQATQQTNSKILKYNVDELIKSTPGLLTTFDDPANVTPNTTVFDNVFGGPLTLDYRGPWRPQTEYEDGDVVVPVIEAGALRPTPLIWYYATVTPAGATPVYSGFDEPNWLLHTATTEDASTGATGGEIDWIPVRSSTNFFPLSYVVDPLGYWTASVDGSAPTGKFGSTTDVTTGVATDTGVGLLRIHGGTGSRTAAMFTCALPDSWQQIFSGPADSASSTTTIDFPASLALTQVTQGTAQSVPHRLVLTSSDRRSTVYRRVQEIVGQQVTLLEPIPARFPSADLGNAELEALTLRYTWFLTVRNNTQGTPVIKCVVVFNRNFASSSEHAYGANFGNPALDIDGDGTDDGDQHGLPGSTAGAWVKIIWDASTEPEPLLKRGNYVFDSRNVDWYRIQDIVDSGSGFAVLTLERNVRLQTLVEPVTPPDPMVIDGRAVLMPGIIEVFDL